MFKNKFVEVICDTGVSGNAEGRIMLVHRLWNDSYFTVPKKYLKKKVKQNAQYYGAPFAPNAKGYIVRKSKHGLRYVAVVKRKENGRLVRKTLGTFDTPKEAHKEYINYQKKIMGVREWQ